MESLTPPIAEYGRDLGGCVTGGYVCRNPNSGRLNGIYVFGDLLSRRTFGLKFDEGWQMAELGMGVFYSTFGEDEAGRIYAANYDISGPGFSTGGIFLIEDSGFAAAPSFSPPSGNSPSEIITLNSLTPNCTIRYTFEPRNPVETDPAVIAGGTVTITNGTTIRAQAFRAGLLPSLVSTGTFNFVTGTPQFDGIPPLVTSRNVPSNTWVTILSATPNAAVYYTLNGSTPTTNSTLYTEPFVITPPRTVMARAFRPEFAAESAVRSVSFGLAAVPMPGISPVFGPFTNATQIAITNGTPIKMGCAFGAAEIFYTLDGTDPTPASAKYVAPFPIAGNTTVKAKAFLTNYQSSAINTILFSLDPNPLVIESIALVTNGTHARITWQSTTGKTYTVKYSADFVTWDVLVDSVAGTGALVSVTDSTVVSAAPQRFYRVFEEF